MTRFLPRACKGVSSGLVRLATLTLIVSLAPPLPAITEAATPSGSDHVLRGASNRYISIESFRDGSAFASGSSTASVTVRVKKADGTDVADGTTVTWTVTTAQNASPAMYQGWGARKTGLNWRNSPRMVLPYDNPDLTASATSVTANGLASVQLTDIVGERVITIEARVRLDDADHTVSQAVRFGDGPLAKFVAPRDENRSWKQAYQLCNGRTPTGEDDPSTWNSGDQGAYRGGGKLPDIDELQAVSAVYMGDSYYSNPNTNPSAKGAAMAAGWPIDDRYWTGVASFMDDPKGVDLDYAWNVGLGNGSDGFTVVLSHDYTVCRR